MPNHFTRYHLRPLPLIKATFPPMPARMFAATTRRSNTTKTFANQGNLPRLPIPDLQQSLEAYLKSLTPLMEHQYDKSSIPNEMEKRKLFVKDFVAPGGLGRTLQERLKDLDHVSPNNWLNDTLWLALAYHTWRAPLIVNSNWWLCFVDDPACLPPPVVSYSGEPVQQEVPIPNPNPLSDLPADSQSGGKEWLKGHTIDPPVDWNKITSIEWIMPVQVRRAAWLAHRFAQFRAKLSREDIPADVIRGVPLCMNQYSSLFNLARIPRPNCDAFSTPDQHALHLSLIIEDYYYSVDIFSSPNKQGDVPEPLPVSIIERRLRECVEDATARKDKGEACVPVGVLSGDERDNWAKNREHLILLQNRPLLHSLSTSLLVLTLDPYTLPSTIPPSQDPLKLPSVDAHIRNCATGIRGGRGRWWDKAIGLIVENNGRSGVSGEHSPADGLIPSIVAEYVLNEPIDQTKFDSALSTSNVQETGPGWERLEWKLDEKILHEIEDVQARNQKIIDNSDASQLWWCEYGVEWIKKNAKQAPDAYLQQVLQLAWYMDQGYSTATYETASTRAFLHGRTDVTRSLTQPSRSFVKSMLDPSSSPLQRYSLLSEACSAHDALTKRSANGLGFDRHLMGLKVQLQPGESHALFEDELYAKSQEWKLSTSGLSAGRAFMGTGFGAAWPDGYGINYLAGPHLIKFGIEGKFSCEKTSTQRFKHHIVQALRDIRELIVSDLWI
nr:carnitine acetyltransferase [Cryptococcus depauperatus CBS 7855]